MIELNLTKPEAKAMLKALGGPSVSDPVLADLYHRLETLIQEATPTAPWRKVVKARESSLYRGNPNTTCCAHLDLECGHSLRETDISAYEVNRGINRGKFPKRRCRECDGGMLRGAMP